jgi:hypothetical protein
MRRALLASSLAVLTLALGACSSWGSEQVYTYNQSEGGSIAASDGVGCGMSRGTATTASVPDEPR